MNAIRRPVRPAHGVLNRMLTTVPRPIHPYTPSWQPANATPIRAEEPSAHHLAVRDAKDYAAQKAAIRASKAQRGFKNDEVIGRRYAIKRLEECLALVQHEKSDSTLRVHLWRAYALAKEFAPDILDTLPDRAWKVLWKSQSFEFHHHRDRRAHLVELYRDMIATGRTPTLDQKFNYLFSLCLIGKREEALTGWQEEYDRAKKPQEKLFQAGWMLHSYCNNLDRAREIMEELYFLYPAADVLHMETVFRDHTRSAESRHHDLAHEMYLRMKDLLGDKITIQHYDNFLMGFLEARHLPYAKQVFEEMVNDRLLASEYTKDHVEQVLRRLSHIFRLGTDIAEATNIAIHAITVLPPPYHSHLFGEWMKLAVVRNAPEAAAQILDMMFDRGYEPETFHFNLLLKALFRTENKMHKSKAENIGWHMVQEAREAQPKKVHFASAGVSICAKEAFRPILPLTLVRRVPSADVNTLAILMRHHSSLSQWEHVEYLERKMPELGLHPNADIMTVLMDSDCRRGQYNEVWKTYVSFTNGSNGVFPNGASLRCLWLTLKLNLSIPKRRKNSTLPSPRKLLAETLRWWELVRRRPDADQFLQGVSGATRESLSKLVMYSFSHVKDLPGQLVAMHALRRNMDLLLPYEAGKIIASQIAYRERRSDAPVEEFLSGAFEQRLGQMLHIFRFFEQRRFTRKQITGDQYEYMSRTEKTDLYIEIISETIRAVLVRQHSPDEVESMITLAKDEVGLPDLYTGDVDAFNVL
jgi:hypothetical protein